MKPEEDLDKKPSGCGALTLYTGILRRRILPKKTATDNLKTNSVSNSKRRRAGSDEASFLPQSNLAESPKLADKSIVTKSPLSPTKTAPPVQLQKIVRKPVDVVSSRVALSSNLGPTKQVPGPSPARRVPKEMTISGELESVIQDHQRTKGSNSLVRASSNMMVFGHLGNIRQPGNTGRPNNNSNSNNVLDYLPKTARETGVIGVEKYCNNNVVMGNIVKKVNANDKENARETPEPAGFCRVLSKRLDPEELKAMGNEEYKKGRFAEALALYDRAISLDPDKASYRSNKSAALIGLGRLLEAVFECREAIKIEPSYCRAHHRLATLYLRLGEGEKAMTHYKQSRSEANSNDIAQARSLQTCLTKCSEARKLRDWHTILKEAECAISSGADSSPQVFSSQAEALLKLQRHQDADTTLASAPVFEMEASTMFFGAASNAFFLLIRAQVHMASGRFDEAVVTAQRAARLDSGNKEVSTVFRRARAVASARSTGNELFKASKYAEACTAYGQGLEHDPFNAILLCNRAACHSKLGQWEKALEDCNTALNLRPSYSKARLRRADCNAKLKRCEASVLDYEALIREMPGDEEVGRALFEARVHLKKERGEDVEDVKFGGDMIVVSSTDQFREFVTSPGMSVVLFSNKSTVILPFVEQLCKKYPSFNFLKVDLDDNPYIGKKEGIASVPAFKIYKNGTKVKDIAGTNQELLESSLKFFSN